MEARFGGDAPSGLFLCCSSIEIITLNETICQVFFAFNETFYGEKSRFPLIFCALYG